MASKPVQISIDEALLKRIDSDREAQENGRSAFLRAAAEFYLKTKRQHEIDEQILAAFADPKVADEMLEEVRDFMTEQAWPES